MLHYVYAADNVFWVRLLEISEVEKIAISDDAYKTAQKLYSFLHYAFAITWAQSGSALVNLGLSFRTSEASEMKCQQIKRRDEQLLQVFAAMRLRA